MNRDIGYLFKKIDERIRIRLNAALSELDITDSQLRLLHFLEERGGSVSQKEAELYLNVSHPTISGLVSRLEKKGFVSSVQDISDRRNKIIHAQKKAEEIGEKLCKEIQENENLLLKSLSKEEEEELRRILLIIYRNLGGEN